MKKGKAKTKAQEKKAKKLADKLRKHNELVSDEETHIPKTARQDTSADQKTSVLFEPYRAFGYYTSQVPFQIYKSGEDTLIATVVGKNAFYVYNSTKLGLVFMSRFIAEEITYLQAAPTGLIYTSLRETNEIVAWNKMHRHQTYAGHSQPIISFIVIGNLIFSLAEEGEFLTFNLQTGQVAKRFTFENTEISGFIHPITYVNKMLFYGGQTMELWNVIEQEQIYKFTLKSEIETVVQSPIVDIVAVGCQDGSINMINLLYDEVLFTFSHRNGAVTSMSFLTDTTLGQSLMASTCAESGTITLWDLNAKKIFAEMDNPHSHKEVTHLGFISGEPVLVSASQEDNSLKMWLFEKG